MKSFHVRLNQLKRLKGKLQKTLLIGVYKTGVQGAASRISNVNIVMQINSKRKYEKYKLKI